MASSKLMSSRNSDLSFSSSAKNMINNNSNSTMTVDGGLVRRSSSPSSSESTLLAAQITLIDTTTTPKTVEDVWREIVSGDRKECKEEAPDEMMTLEDFLAKAGAVEEEEEDVKVPPPPTRRLSTGAIFPFDPTSFHTLDKVEGSIIGFGNGIIDVTRAGGGGGGGGRGKRARPVLEPLDKAAQQRQRRMIKNRESAARSRERKQAYQVELESLAVCLEEENQKLLKEKAERTNKRFKQLMKNVVPALEKQRPVRVLHRVRSLQW